MIGGLPPHVGPLAIEIAAAMKHAGYMPSGKKDGRGITLLVPPDAPDGVLVAFDEVVLLMLSGAVEGVLSGAVDVKASAPSPAPARVGEGLIIGAR